MQNTAITELTHLMPSLTEDEGVHFKLSDHEKSGIENLISILKDHDLNNPLPFIKTAKRLCPILLSDLNQQLFKLTRHEVDSIFIQNLPVFPDEESTRALSLLIACMFGKPFQYQQQNHGEIVARITPEPGQENTNSSSGRMRFGWHTDDSFLDECFRTDFILLCGYLNPFHVKTLVSSIETIRKKINSQYLFELLKPQYSLGLPASFRRDSSVQLNEAPLIWFDGSRKLNIALSEYNVTTEETVGQNAINALLDIAETNAKSYDLQSGNMLIFKNNRVLHSRGQIVGDRTIFRVYVKESLLQMQKSSEDTSQYVFDLNVILNEVNSQH